MEQTPLFCGAYYEDLLLVPNLNVMTNCPACLLKQENNLVASHTHKPSKRPRGGIVGFFTNLIWGGEEEEINQSQHVMFEVNATVSDCKLCKGYRATVFKCAQDHKAFYQKNKEQSIYYEGDSNDLKIRLWFKDEQLAFDFQNALDNFWFEHPSFGVKIDVDEIVKTIDVSSSVSSSRVFFKHYNSADNEDSPEVSLYQIKNVLFSHSSSVLTISYDPQKSIQALEDLTIFKGLKCYWMHLISRKDKRYATDPDNCIYGSWIFHQYFDSLNAVNNYPEVAVKYENAENPVSLDLGGIWETRTKVNVTIEFIDEDVARLISQYLKKEGTEAVPNDRLKFRSCLYAHNAEKMKYFLDSKYKKTKALWDQMLV
eukprot:gene4708-6609_t